jgi:hypothetical protein
MCFEPVLALDVITATNGSFDRYVRDAMQLSDAGRALLRERLLEP